MAVAGLALALAFRFVPGIGVALGLLGAEYAAFFAVRGDTADVRAPLYGAAFLVVAELAYAAVELRAGRPEPGIAARRVAALTVIALAAVGAGTLALAAGSAPLEGGVALEAAGVVAAVGLLVALGRLAVRSR